MLPRNLKKHNRLISFLFVILLINIAFSCGKPDDTPGRKNLFNENVLRYDVNSPFTSLNPAKVFFGGSTNVFPLLYSFLFIPDENEELQPDLAQNWSYDRKSFTWSIHIRKNVLFHNGKILSPEDVIYSLNISLKSFLNDIASQVDNISAFSDHNVHIRLKDDYPNFLVKIWDTPILPRPDGTDIDFFYHPVGSGPFKFKLRQGNSMVVLEANKDYCAGCPAVNQIIFLFQPDREKAWTRLLAGETDIAQEISYKNFQMMRQYQERFYFNQYILRFYTILLYNTNDSLFSDPAVRRALTYAIDREHIVKYILKGNGVVANGPMGVGSPYHNPEVKPLPFDPQQAMALLKEAGWIYDKESGCLYKEGRPFEFTIFVFDESQIEKKVASYIQLCLNDLGIRVRLRAFPFEDFKKRYFRNNQFQAVLTELRGAYRNPEYLQTNWSYIKNGKSAAGCFKHPTVTGLFKKGIAEKDLEKQKKIFYKIDLLITSLQPGTFLFQKTAIDVMSKRFRIPHPFSLTYEGIYRLKYASLDQDWKYPQQRAH